MSLKLIGIIAVVTGCGGFGFYMAAAHRREVKYIRQFLTILDQMQCELEYRLTPLPELCRIVCETSSGSLHELFSSLSNELESQVAPDAQCCMNAAVARSDLPQSVKRLLKDLGQTLGRFDINGQLRGIQAVRSEASQILTKLTKDQDARIRSYQTLGLCAGAALAILLL